MDFTSYYLPFIKMIIHPRIQQMVALKQCLYVMYLSVEHFLLAMEWLKHVRVDMIRQQMDMILILSIPIEVFYQNIILNTKKIRT
jgi:hypothetical protein